MITEQEHEIVPAIRSWLAATCDTEVPTGPSREEASRRARELIVAVAAETATLDDTAAVGDLMDILWAAVEELDSKPLGKGTFEECDRLYRFVLALSVANDLFGEKDQLLHRIARIGWRSGPGGLEAVLKTRASVWEHCDAERHRRVREGADQLPVRIDALCCQQAPEVAELLEICKLLLNLNNSCPSLIAPAALKLAGYLDNVDFQSGHLDDWEYVKGSIHLLGGMAARHFSGWKLATLRYEQAALAFARTADVSDLDRIEAERLALRHMKGDYADVVKSEALIERMTINRERLKARLIVASALVNLGQPREALEIFETCKCDPAVEQEPELLAWLLIKQGTALSSLGMNAKAAASFCGAGKVLRQFRYPALSADLIGAFGEHLGRQGKLNETVVLYRVARQMYSEFGEACLAAYLSVLIAELLVLLGRDGEAEAELIGALPSIEKLDLRREGLAAIGLLRETMSKHRPDLATVVALRDQLRKGLH